MFSMLPRAAFTDQELPNALLISLKGKRVFYVRAL